jgi:hypothetical protein
LDGAEELPTSVKRVTLRFKDGAPRGLNDKLMQAMIDHDIIEPLQDARSRKLGTVRVQSFELKTGSSSEAEPEVVSRAAPETVDASPRAWVGGAVLLGSLLAVTAIAARTRRTPPYEAAQVDDTPIE